MVYKITSKFMQQEAFRNKPHSGIDFAMKEGEPIRSIQDGIIQSVVDYGNQNIGKGILIKWNDGKVAIHGHMSQTANLKVGDTIHQGDLLGYAGSTGFSTGNHLHFGLKEGNRFIDPSPFIENIQHMNDPNFIAQTVQTKVNFMDYFHQHMELIGSQLADFKLQFIHLLASTDYSPLIQLLKGIVQFIFFNS